jgi:hypothetical protein
VNFVNITFHKNHGLLLLTDKKHREYAKFSSEDLQQLHNDNEAKLDEDEWL